MIFYLSIGSNIEPEKNISFAIKKLNELLEDLIQSSIIISKAEGFIGDDFHNLVVSGRSNLTFNEMNKHLKASRILLIEIVMFQNLVLEP